MQFQHYPIIELNKTPGEIYGFEGAVYDVHVYLHYYETGEEILVGEFEWEEPLVPCQEYPLEVNLGDSPPLGPDDYIKLVLTDKDGNPIGWSTSQPGPQ